MTGADARRLATLAHRHGGLDLDPAKTQFFESRLARFRPLADFASADALICAAEADERLGRRLVETLTTHTTSFFREAGHFRWLHDTGFSELAGRNVTSREPVTIWSAACSSGVELWSAGMAWFDWQAAGNRRKPIAFFGTDLSHQILRRAAGATYRDEEIAGVDDMRRARYLLRSQAARDASGLPYWRVCPELRSKTTFLQANLMDLSSLQPFRADVIFLRNVLIYFDEKDRERVVRGVVGRLRPGGVLLTGHAERIDPAKFDLTAAGPSIYRKTS